MDHQLVANVESALGWSGPGDLGRSFRVGTLPDPDLCGRLLTPSRLLDMVMRRSLAYHRLRVLVDGVDLHPQDYLTVDSTRRGAVSPMADMRRLGRWLREGCTLTVDALNLYDATLEVACRALQWWARELTQVNAYLTTGSSSGFELHWDDHDVLIVQLAGEKTWEVRGSSRPAPMYRDAVPNLDPPDEAVWKGVLHAGEVMHIPRGFWHRATRENQGEGFSLHVTFGLTKRTGVDWLMWLADHTREIQSFRHDLERWGDPLAGSRQQRNLVLTASHQVTSRERSITRFLAEREQQMPSARHVQTHSLFGKPSTVVCVTEFPPAIENYDGKVVVSAAGSSITFDGSAAPALDLLLSGNPVQVDDAATQADVDIAQIVDILLGEEILAEATPELLSGYASVADYRRSLISL